MQIFIKGDRTKKELCLYFNWHPKKLAKILKDNKDEIEQAYPLSPFANKLPPIIIEIVLKHEGLEWEDLFKAEEQFKFKMANKNKQTQ